MNNDIQKLYELTLLVVDRLDDITYEELADFANNRLDMVSRIELCKEQLKEEDKEIIRQLMNFDTKILAKMDAYKNEASEWLLKQGAIRDQKMAYNSSYTPDSLFFDHKK
jgi:hypothetical protein